MKLISFTGLRRLTCMVVLLLGGLLNVALFSQETDNVKSELFREIDAAMNSAKEEEVPILSPNLYAKAMELYRRADAEYKKGERLDKIRKRINEAKNAFAKAIDAAEVTKVALAEILKIRKESANRESATLAPNEFRKAEGKYKEAILKAEAGDIRSAKKKADEAIRAYCEMIVTTLLKGPVKKAEDQLKKSRSKLSSQTYKTAERDLKTLKISVQNAKKQKFNPAEYEAKIRAQIGSIIFVIQSPSKSTSSAKRTQTESKTLPTQKQAKIKLQTSNWPLYARLSTVKPVSREEEEFAKALADKLNHTTAVVASNPTVRFPARSLAARVQAAYRRLDRRKQAAMQKNARALLSKTDADRQRYFGAYAARNADRRLRQADDPGPGCRNAGAITQGGAGAFGCLAPRYYEVHRTHGYRRIWNSSQDLGGSRVLPGGRAIKGPP